MCICFAVFTEIISYMGRRFFLLGNLVVSTMMLMQNDYKFCGELMVMSILQGGPAPSLLSQTVFEYLISDLKIENIHSSQYKRLCEEVIAIHHIKLLNSVFTGYP